MIYLYESANTEKRPTIPDKFSVKLYIYMYIHMFMKYTKCTVTTVDYSEHSLSLGNWGLDRVPDRSQCLLLVIPT